MTAEKWLARALVASFLVNVLLAVWLWSARQPEDVLIATQEYVRTRVVYDTAKVEREVAVTRYRTLRDTINIADTVAVKELITVTNEVIVRDSVALAAADSALARADALISVLQRSTKPKLLTPWVDVLYNPYSREVVGRIGLDVRTIKNVSLVVAAEVRREGPQALAGIRVRF